MGLDSKPISAPPKFISDISLPGTTHCTKHSMNQLFLFSNGILFRKGVYKPISQNILYGECHPTFKHPV